MSIRVKVDGVELSEEQIVEAQRKLVEAKKAAAIPTPAQRHLNVRTYPNLEEHYLVLDPAVVRRALANMYGKDSEMVLLLSPTGKLTFSDAYKMGVETKPGGFALNRLEDGRNWHRSSQSR